VRVCGCLIDGVLIPDDGPASHELPQGLRMEGAPGEAAILVTCHEMYGRARGHPFDGDIHSGQLGCLGGFQ
jgi:hypothetical protein